MQRLDDISARVLASTDRFTRQMYTCDGLVFTSGTEEESSAESQNIRETEQEKGDTKTG